MTQQTWDREVDVIVAGSGASGMSAAITAHLAGREVLMVEKTDRIGGSTAISGGAVWAPLNRKSAAAGHPDSYEQAWTYMRETVGEAAPAELQRAFLDACGEALAYLEANTRLNLAARTYSPDYYPERAGAALGGRSLDPLAFDGRLLGRHFRELRDPLREFMVLGGMMITLTDAKQLLSVWGSRAAFKAGAKLVLRYLIDRVRGFHRGTRLVLGNALAAQLFMTVLERAIPYQLNTRVTSLLVEDGAVCGAVFEHRGGTQRVRARHGVVVATGGFPWHAQLREALYPQPTGPWSMSPNGNAGEGIALARGAGARLGTGHFAPAFFAPVSIRTLADGSQIRYPHLVWDRAKPGLIAVNAAGQRFVNESTSYHEFVLGMYRSHETVPTLPAFLVCDRPFIDRWGLGLALPGGRPRRHLIRDGYLFEAPTLDALAGQLGVDAAGLRQSVAQFNQAARTGVDDAFHKGSTAYNQYLGDPDHAPNPCLGALEQGPFYAVKVYAGDIGTACGIRCDGRARALDEHGRPIPGLYVVGNDMHSVMGGQYPAPGITLGPALTFGYLAGREVSQAPRRTAREPELELS